MGKNSKLYNFFRNLNDGPQLLLCAYLGIVVWQVLTLRLSWQHASLIGWMTGAISYLLWVAFVLSTDHQAHELRNRFTHTEPNKIKLLTVIAIILLFSILFVGILLSSLKLHKSGDHTWLLVLSGLSIILSWLVLHTSFALHYARLYYDNDDEYGNPFPDGIRAGLIFPGDEDPVYIDFFYFSFSLGLTYAVSDVNVSRSDMRKVIFIHSMFSFFFYSTVITLVLNTIVTID